MKTKTVFTLIMISSSFLWGNIITFETFPDGSPTLDRQLISNQYWDTYGVKFELIDKLTGQFIGYPEIAKAGLPLTAFWSCGSITYADTPIPGQNLGSSFLTYDDELCDNVNLLIIYREPVKEASGVMIDVDLWTSEQYEQWEIVAQDPNGLDVGITIIDSRDLPNSEYFCQNGHGRNGDGYGVTWSFDLTSSENTIKSILFKSTGTIAESPVAFDNFSPALSQLLLSVNIISETFKKICSGETVNLIAEPSGGILPYAYQWQKYEDSNWIDLGTTYSQTVFPESNTDYRVILIDSDDNIAISDPFTIYVCLPNPDLNSNGCIDIEDFAILSRKWLEGCE